MTKMTRRDSYNLRLHTEDKEAFFALRTSLDLSPRDCLVMLMEYYRAGHSEVSDEEREDYPIEVLMQIRAQGGKHTPLRKISIMGKKLYDEQAYCRILSPEEAEELSKDFGLQMNPRDIMYYLVTSALRAYWCTEKGCYLVQEELELWVNRDEIDIEDIYTGRMPENPMSVRRCAFVKDYDELIAKFGKYANGIALQDLERIMAKDIGKNYLLMDEFF